MSGTISIQTILYNTELNWLDKFLDCLAACVVPAGFKLVLKIGDASKEPVLDGSALDRLAKRLAGPGIEVKYLFFNGNLGFSKGHNRLFFDDPAGEYLILLNPDTVFPYHLIERLVELTHQRPDYGIIEARQLPLEHPKAFNQQTLQTGWASGACCLLRPEAFQNVNGFDEIFFMYCEDVDLSWRIRAAGFKVYYCPTTFVYHSKRLTASGMEASYAERLYGPVSSMLLRAKYGRPDLNEAVINWLKSEPDRLHKQILEYYNQGLRNLTPANPVQAAEAYFSPDGNFAEHRWQYQSYEASAKVSA